MHNRNPDLGWIAMDADGGQPDVVKIVYDHQAYGERVAEMIASPLFWASS